MKIIDDSQLPIKEQKMSFLRLREDRPATIDEHRALRAEIEKLRAALMNAIPHLPWGGGAWLDAKAALGDEQKACPGGDPSVSAERR